MYGRRSLRGCAASQGAAHFSCTPLQDARKAVWLTVEVRAQTYVLLEVVAALFPSSAIISSAARTRRKWRWRTISNAARVAEGLRLTRLIMATKVSDEAPNQTVPSRIIKRNAFHPVLSTPRYTPKSRRRNACFSARWKRVGEPRSFLSTTRTTRRLRRWAPEPALATPETRAELLPAQRSTATSRINR
jgi:hypothetical protein